MMRSISCTLTRSLLSPSTSPPSMPSELPLLLKSLNSSAISPKCSLRPNRKSCLHIVAPRSRNSPPTKFQACLWPNLQPFGNRTSGPKGIYRHQSPQTLYPPLHVTFRFSCLVCQVALWIATPLLRLSSTPHHHHHEALPHAF